MELQKVSFRGVSSKVSFVFFVFLTLADFTRVE